MQFGRMLVLGTALLGCGVTAILLLAQNHEARRLNEPSPTVPALETAPAPEPSAAAAPINPRQEVSPSRTVDPATLGTTLAQQSATAPDAFAQGTAIDLAILPDPRLRMFLEGAEKGIELGRKTGKVDWWDEAQLKLMLERRYWYLGPAEACPDYKNTPNAKYLSTHLPRKPGEPDTKVVWEVTRQEFPRAFEEEELRRKQRLVLEEELKMRRARK